MNVIGTFLLSTSLIILSLAGVDKLLCTISGYGSSWVSYLTCVLGIVVFLTGLGVLCRGLIAEILDLSGDDTFRK
ncbi:hypothetical protein PU629_09365 [Pullulanibacillus sp. KACC 23026]|uniref:hypothetical protein n=1 Tax=Pullulanibacillus sp. KACC 23026 TaxID=3028315 RepID=UPI0023B07AFF|nr:hypothetical protein [Pullulanibacillus sp. KACC 23026]WEG14544.1 hypothetical protein PU629_09365 [Pullulanibacillus sp. KACC 23026]